MWRPKRPSCSPQGQFVSMFMCVQFLCSIIHLCQRCVHLSPQRCLSCPSDSELLRLLEDNLTHFLCLHKWNKQTLRFHDCINKLTVKDDRIHLICICWWRFSVVQVMVNLCCIAGNWTCFSFLNFEHSTFKNIDSTFSIQTAFCGPYFPLRRAWSFSNGKYQYFSFLVCIDYLVNTVNIIILNFFSKATYCSILVILFFFLVKPAMWLRGWHWKSLCPSFQYGQKGKHSNHLFVSFVTITFMRKNPTNSDDPECHSEAHIFVFQWHFSTTVGWIANIPMCSMLWFFQ